MRYGWILLAFGCAAAAVPLRFEENRGQAPAEARFLVRGTAGPVWLTGDGAVWEGVRMRFGGAAAAAVHGLDALEGTTSYLRGGNASNWRTGIASYRRVRYEGVFPGIDAVFYSNLENELEFDFVVAPGADPARIVLEFEGRRRPVVTRSGDLQLGSSRLLRPIVRQGDGKRVAGRYVVLGGNRAGFRLGKYDSAQTLIIDPVLAYGSYLGGTGGGSGESIAVDTDGNIYVTGNVATNYFPLASPLQEFYFGSNEVYVTKFDPTGSRLIYSTYIGSWGDDRALDIAVDREGHAYVTGHTTSPDFPVTENAFQRNYGGGSLVNGGDAFVLKLSPSGDRLIYSTFFGGIGNEYARSIALDGEGNAYITGSTTSPDLPLRNPIQDMLMGPRDLFVAKLGVDGASVLYSTYLGGEGTEEGNAIAVDETGGAHITGSATNAQFPLVNPLQTTYGGGTRDVVIAKLNPEGSALVFSTIYGGTGDDTGRGIAVDREGFIYVTGYATSSSYPTRNRLRGSAGGREAILTKLAADGQEVIFSTFLGGNSTDDAYGIALDAEGHIYLTGMTQSQNFPAVEAIQQSIGSPCSAIPCTADAFIARIKGDGSELLFSTYLGGRAADQARAIAVDRDGSLYVTGFTSSVDFPVVAPFQNAYNGGGPSVTFLVRLENGQ